MRVLEHFWYGVRPSHIVLYPLSIAFRATVALRRALYRAGWLHSVRLPVPLIVVGNIGVGGTGKTPLVLWLCEFLRRHGERPGIVTRGYGGSERLQHVQPDSDPAQAGDEPVLLARRSGLPVFVARDRVAAARALLAAEPACSVIISDDGLQHYRMQRDVEVAVVDGERRFGNGWLLPAGPLREPVRRLDEVTAIVINGADARLPDRRAPQFGMRLRGSSFRNLLRPTLDAVESDWKANTLHAVAGIGNPERFFATLRTRGLTFRAHPFPDHFRFTADDLAFAGEDTLLMTEKDAVKCAAFARDHWWFLPVEADVDPGFGDLILAQLRRAHGRQAA